MSFWISYCGNMTSYRFFKMAAAVAQYYFRFRIFDVLAFRRSKSINKPNFVDINGQHISIYGWNITTSGLEKQTSTLLEFYFRFWSRPLPVISMSLCITLPNFVQIGPPTHCMNMTSFPFFKMAAATAKYQFRFRICWCHCLQKVKVYQQTKFRRRMSNDGWDITTSVFLKQTSAILNI